jgi:transcriptional regulator with XRE-family HTH domain
VSDADTASTRALAERLDHLFRTVRSPTGREYRHEEVAKAIAESQAVSISPSYIWYLRTGQRDNPTFRHLSALARFFGVPPAYFFDDGVARQIEAELALVAAMRDVGVRTVAMRAEGLSPESLRAVTSMIDRVRQLEGLPRAERQPSDP